MRILVDQSAYDLLNLGDVAMLQACVVRLRTQWPDADIMAMTHAPDLLTTYCPDVTSIGGSLAHRPILRGLRGRYGWTWKSASLYLHGQQSAKRAAPAQPRTVSEAVRAADLVVASGGGYLTDAFWWHAVGVFSVLTLAQRLGKPTAMFGQGIDFMSSRLARVQARSVLPGLAVLGLREGLTSPAAAAALGADRGRVKITGDDALELLPETTPDHGDALGFNIRMTGYAGMAAATTSPVALPVLEAAHKLGAPIVALPISRYPDAPDLGAIDTVFRGLSRHSDLILEDLTTPQQLINVTSKCRAIVTGSYHAAVFALGLGIPAVCLTRTPYYDAKFKGLQGLFPSLVTVVQLDQSDLARHLRGAIVDAWDLPDDLRAEARAAAVEQREAGRSAYRDLVSVVDADHRSRRTPASL